MDVLGTMVRFDEVKGYGFAAPDGGGADVFVHANDLLVDKSALAAGVRVMFVVEDGDRGQKASAVRLAPGADGVARPVTAPVPVASPVDRSGSGIQDAEDVLDRADWEFDVTEALLESCPTLTGTQIVAVRRAMGALAVRHGWVA